MISNTDKQRVLMLGLDKLERIMSKAVFRASAKAYYNFEDDESSQGFLDALQDYANYDKQYGSDWHIAKAINNSTYRRKQRLQDKITECVMTNKAIFLTIDFNDDAINNLSSQTRRTLVSRYLKQQCSFYVANKDYGKKNGREHYHAIVVPKLDKIDYLKWYKAGYGGSNGKRIPPTQLDILRVCKYVAKFKNHAIKQTASGERFIYSRQTA